MKENPISYYKDDARILQLVDYLNDKKSVFCKGIVGSAKAFVVAAAFEKLGGQHFVVCPDKENAAYFYNDLENIFGERETDYAKKMILFYPTSYKRPYEPEKPDNTYILSRTEVLQRVSTSERKTIIVSYPEALSEKIVTRKILSKNALKLAVGEKVDMDFVTDTLLHALNYCGGLVGYQEQGDNSKISGCYNTSGVYGSNYIGGLIGYSNSSTVRNSYVAGVVSGQGNAVGGIIGGAHEVLMYNSYYNIDITNQNAAIGENYFKEGEGKTTSQMRSPQFVATMNQGLSPSIWMADIFPNINNGFPILHWQAENHFGIDENEAVSNHLVLYPNPANELVTIKLDDVECGLNQIRVFDVSGREVLSANASGQEYNLNVSGLLKGIYFIRVITEDDGVANLKLVVK